MKNRLYYTIVASLTFVVCFGVMTTSAHAEISVTPHTSSSTIVSSQHTTTILTNPTYIVSVSPSMTISSPIQFVNHGKNNQRESSSQPIGNNIPLFSVAQNAMNGLTTVFTTTVDVFSMMVLSFTHTNWWVLALFGNIMMLLWGAYLRLRSGRSPGYLTVSLP